MAAASLSLLKINKDKGTPKPEPEVAAATAAKATPAPVTAPAPEEKVPAEEPVVESAAVEENVEVDPDTMSGEELDALVAEHGIETPESWHTGMSVEEKRLWLKSQFEETSPDPASTPAPAEPKKADSKASKELATGKEVAVTKPKPPTKAASAKAAKELHGEVQGPNALTEVVHTIENLTEKDAKGAVHDLVEGAEQSYFKLGGVLSVIQKNGWFTPHASFKEFVENEHGIAYRKAMYYIDIYNKLAESDVPWDKVKALGWTRLKEIASILTKENVDEWVKVASGQTVLQLIETVKNHKAQAVAGSSAPALTDQTSATVTTKTFKVHDDQKATIEAAIAKAKEVSGTPVDTVALEHICLDYMGGAPKVASQPDMKAMMKTMGYEKVLDVFGEVFPEVSLTAEVPE